MRWSAAAAAGVGVASAADGLRGRERLDLHPASPQLVDHRGIGPELPVGAAAEDQPLGELVQDLVEVAHGQRVTLTPPPIGHHALGQDDQVAGVLLADDGDPPEAVVLELCHRLGR